MKPCFSGGVHDHTGQLQHVHQTARLRDFEDPAGAIEADRWNDRPIS